MTLSISGFDVALRPAIPPEHEAANQSAPFHPSVKELPAGFRKTQESAPFTVDTIFEKDVKVPMRDGNNLYCDIFRPKGKDQIPAILVWSPYGKGGNGPHGLHMIDGRFGVPAERLSGHEKFEGLDPADWVSKGYAVINFDLRGCWNSDGIIPWLGSQDGRDGYDAIEFVAQVDWCNGKVALAGNSWLAMSQWFIAAETPPHLAAFAPWEGASDFYQDTLCRGGVPYPYKKFWKILESSMVGRSQVESITDMINRYPLYNEYWEDKKAKLNHVKAPAYVLASYSTSLHTSGSIRGYNDLGSSDKLRIHPKQEWSDLYSQESTDDLRKFFDYYTKGVPNGWKDTPKVRVSLLRFNEPPIENLPFPSYPVPQTKYQKLFLGPSNSLTEQKSLVASQMFYQSDYVQTQTDDNTEELVFTHKFEKASWLIGYSKVVLHVSAHIPQELDVFVQLRKVDEAGTVLQFLNVPLQKLIPPKSTASEVPDVCFLKYTGPTGVLRVTHAGTKIPEVDEASWPQYHHNEKVEATEPGKIYRVEVPIWPAEMVFEAGESLALKVSGHYMSMMEFEFLNHQNDIENKGRHTIYLGGEYDSHLVIPIVEPFSFVYFWIFYSKSYLFE